jgi:hypothetical protein
MVTPTSLKSGWTKLKLAGVLWTVNGTVAVAVADPACPVSVILKLPIARFEPAWKVIDAPPLGTERGKVVVVLRPAGNAPRLTVGVVGALDEVTVTVILLLGTMTRGLGVTASPKN